MEAIISYNRMVILNIEPREKQKGITEIVSCLIGRSPNNLTKILLN